MKASTLANVFLDATTLTSAEAEVGKMAKAGKGFKAGKAKMSQDVCIIGGGPSGLTAALRLHDKGYKHITIFEKADAIGGKAQNWVDPDGHVHYKGAVFYLPSFYSETTNLLERYGIPYRPYQANISYYNYETKYVLPRSAPTDPTALMQQVVKYTQMYANFSSYLIPGFRNGVPNIIRVPTQTFLLTNGMPLLIPVFWLINAAFGYGSLQDTPACYALQLNPPQVVAGFLTQGPTPLYMTDYASLFIRAAADSGADIQELNAVITNIDHHHDNSVKSVKYVQKGKSGKSQTKKCDQLIHAIPYNLEEDGRFGFDQEQQAVLHDIIVEPYYTSYVKMTELKFGERYYPLIHGESNKFGEFKGVGEPISGFKQDNLTRYTNVYSWHRNPKPADFSTAQVKGLVNQYLEFLCLDRDEAGECTPLEVEAIFPWRYFAHVNSSSIQAGWFTRLEDLQGQRNTYFTGSARSFEIIEMVVRSAYDIVDRFF
jgi:hypothetical protein